MNSFKKARLKNAVITNRILTQREVAEKLGVQMSAVSKWEMGLSKPRAELLPALAKIYKCSVDDLLREDDDNEKCIRRTV